MLEIIQQAIKSHDKYQIEIKLDYELLDGKETHYKIYTYIFVPHSLHINQESYQKSDFYRDVQNYIRLKTPILGLDDFCNIPSSPLVNIQGMIQTNGWKHNDKLKMELINRLKLLSSMLKSSLREHFNLIHKRIKETPESAKVHQIIFNLVEQFVRGTSDFSSHYRTLFAAFNQPGVNEEIFSAYSLTDESISLLIEETAIEMYQIVETYLKNEKRQLFLEQLQAIVKSETKHRRARGYASILQVGEENETYIFRASVLKKYAASVLHLSTAVSREGRGMEQFLFAIAAGISMIIATTIAFFFQQQFGNFTFPFFVALVVGYMFKDRVKELGREMFASKIRDRVYDRRIEINSSDGKHKLGILREKMDFVKEADIPNPVLRARNKDPFSDLENDSQGEVIIRYTKDIVLYANAFKKLKAEMPGINGLNDIIRYDIRQYLKKMAEPLQERPYLINGNLKTIYCHKVYHLNFVSRYRSLYPHKEKLHRRIRLVLNQKGIKRIEDIAVE